MICKPSVATILCSVLGMFSAYIECSIARPFSPTTPASRAAIAQHVAKDGLQDSRKATIERGAVPTSPEARDAMNRGISDYLKLLSEDGAKKYAATSFLAFYMIRSRSVTDICQAESVDVSAYSYAFQVKHASLLVRANELTEGYRPPDAGMISTAFLDRTRQEADGRMMLSRIAAGLQKSRLVDACMHLATNESDGSSVQSFEEEFPQLAAILMSAAVRTVTSEISALPAQHAMGDSSTETRKAVTRSGSDVNHQAHTERATDPVMVDLRILNQDGAKKYAARRFFAFYITRTQIEPDVCRSAGIDVTAYIRAFRSSYQTEFARSVELTEGSNFAMGQVRSELMAVREWAETVARRFLIEVAASNSDTTVAGGCAYLAEHTAKGLAIQSFAKLFPELEPILMSDESPNKRPGSLPTSNPYLGHPINRRRSTHDESAGTSQ